MHLPTPPQYLGGEGHTWRIQLMREDLEVLCGSHVITSDSKQIAAYLSSMLRIITHKVCFCLHNWMGIPSHTLHYTPTKPV